MHGGAMALKMIWQIQKMSVPCTTKASGMQSRLPKKSKFNQNRFAYKKHLYSEPLKKGQEYERTDNERPSVADELSAR